MSRTPLGLDSSDMVGTQHQQHGTNIEAIKQDIDDNALVESIRMKAITIRCLSNWNVNNTSAFCGDEMCRVVTTGEPCPACQRPGLNVVMTSAQFHATEKYIDSLKEHIMELKKKLRTKRWEDKWGRPSHNPPQHLKYMQCTIL